MKKSLLTGLALIVSACASMKITAVNYSPKVVNNFAIAYTMSRRARLETALCMEGHQSHDTLYVTRTFNPVVYRATEDSIEYTCDPTQDYLGAAHTHPGRIICVPSVTDSTTFANDHSSRLLAVLCETGFVTKVKN